jgi:hypothetical protein
LIGVLYAATCPPFHAFRSCNLQAYKWSGE